MPARLRWKAADKIGTTVSRYRVREGAVQIASGAPSSFTTGGTAEYPYTYRDESAAHGTPYDVIADFADGTSATSTGAMYQTTPAAVLNLGTGAGKNPYSLQMPEDTPHAGAPDVHTLTELVGGYTHDPFFKVVGNDGVNRVQFHTPANGATTSGSSFARTEFRERKPDDSGNAAWTFATGTHVLKGTVRMPYLPAADPEMVFAQVHNGTDDVVSLRSQLISGATKLLWRNDVGAVARFTEAYALGTEFTYKIEIVNGIVRVYYNDMTTPHSSWDGSAQTSTSSYFKTGAYAQYNTTTVAASEYGIVELRDLSTSHA